MVEYKGVKEEVEINKHIDFAKVIQNKYTKAEKSNVIIPLRFINQPFHLGILENNEIDGFSIKA